jgi:hypothetical protein
MQRINRIFEAETHRAVQIERRLAGEGRRMRYSWTSADSALTSAHRLP